MSSAIAQELTDQLRRRIGQGEGSVSVDGAGVSVGVDVEQSERYAVGVRGFEVAPAQPVSDVREVAERVVDGVTALDDRLQVVEVDAAAGRAVVRSTEPERDEAGVTYWEADVRNEATSLRRYRKDHSTPDREVVTEPLPHAVAGRIGEQLADAITRNQ